MRLHYLILAALMLAPALRAQDNSYALNSQCSTPEGDYQFGVYVRMYEPVFRYSSDAAIAKMNGVLDANDLLDTGQEVISGFVSFSQASSSREYATATVNAAYSRLGGSVRSTGNSFLGQVAVNMTEYTIGAALAFGGGFWSGGSSASGQRAMTVFAIDRGIGALRAGVSTISVRRLTASVNTYNVVRAIAFPYFKSCGDLSHVAASTGLPIPYPQVESVFFPWAVAELEKSYGTIDRSEATAILNELHAHIPTISGSLQSRLNTPSPTAPGLGSMSPSVLIGSPSSIPITLRGSGFGPSTRLRFNDGSRSYLRTPTYINASTLQYGVNVGTEGGTWTVEALNGGAASPPLSFNVEPQPDVVPPGPPQNFNVMPLGWSRETTVKAIWDNPDDRSGINRVWYKLGSSPTGPSDGVSLDAQRNTPLVLELPGSGETLVHVWLEDGEGNRSHTNRVSVPIRVDGTAPSVSITSPNTNGTHSTGDASFDLAGNAADSDSGLRYVVWISAGSAGFADVAGGRWEAEGVPLQPGENRVLAVAIDQAWNVSVDSIRVTSSASGSGYSLGVNVLGAGQVVVDPELSEYPDGSIVNLTAVPGEGESFNRWSGDVSGSNNPIVLTMNQSKDVTARFETSGANTSVTVILQPAGAVAAGAQWKYGDGPWLDSGATRQITISPNTYANVEINYKDIPGWEAPRRDRFLLPFGESRTVISDPYVEDDVPAPSAGRLIGTNAEETDYFGNQLSLVGDLAVVGIQNDGRIYTFGKESSGWIEIDRLEANDVDWAHRFEGGVSQWGGWLVVGDPLFGEQNDDITGAVHILSRSSPGWRYEETVMTPEPALSLFGDGVSISDNVIVASEKWATVDGLSMSGAVIVYEWDGQQWSLSARITHPEPVGSGTFGESVTVSGDLILVSAKKYAGGPAESGAVYVFRRSSDGWVQEERLTSPTGSNDDLFGSSGTSWGSLLAAERDRIAVGASYADPGGVQNAGAVYTYTATPSGWALEAELAASNALASDWLGGAVALSGDLLIAGARGRDNVGSASGTAYVFRNVNGTWVETGELQPDPAVSGASFGASVSVSGERALIGAPRDGLDGIENRGSASVFDLEYNYPPQASSITTPSDGFGFTATLDGGALPVEWTDSTDPESAPLSYRWLLAATDTFTDPLLTSGETNETSYSLTFADLDTVLGDLGLGPGEEVTLYHRVTVSDESHVTAGPSHSLVVTRGGSIGPLVELSLPDVSGSVGQQLRVPIDVNGLDGRDVLAYQMELAYDAGIVSFQSIDKTGTLSEGWNVTANGATPGTTIISGANATAFTSDGVLLYLVFDLIADGTSTLDWRSGRLNEGDPQALVSRGSIAVSSCGPCGDVTDNGSVSSFDASYILRRVAQLDNPTFARCAADPTQNGEISSLDASYILQHTSGTRPELVCGAVPGINAKSPGDAIAADPNALPATWGAGVGESGVWTLDLSLNHEALSATLDIETGAGTTVTLPEGSLPEGWVSVSNRTDTGMRFVIAGAVAMPVGWTIPLRLSAEGIGAASVSGTVRVDEGLAVELAPLSLVEKPEALALSVVSPNPAGAQATVTLSLPETSSVRVELVDVLGRVIQVVDDRAFDAGSFVLEISTRSLAPGRYFLAVTTESGKVSRSFTVAR